VNDTAASRRTRLLVATGNPGKVREFALALGEAGFDVCGLEALESSPGEVEETGDTFEANARIKAEAYSRHTPLWVVADDSGLEVDALGGAPGVQSARYGGPELDDEGRNRKLLVELAGVADAERTARFRCVLALARGGETVATFDGTVEGRIQHEPAGDNGFGYDPLFHYPPAGCTTAQLSPGKKQRISHRGKAIASLIEALRTGAVDLANRG
jgi:XTP/dITP diphosphohydrolase